MGPGFRLRLFARPEHPRVQMTSVGQRKFLSLCGFSGASNGTFCARLGGGVMARTQVSPGGGPDGQDPGNRRLCEKARVSVRGSGQARLQRTEPGRGPPQALVQVPRARLSLTPRGIPGWVRSRWLTMLGQAQGAALETCSARSEFAGRFPANSHERSAQTGINLGRTLVRIGRRWAALRTALLPGAEGPFSLGACRGPPESTPKDMAQPRVPAEGSVPQAELKDVLGPGVRLRLFVRPGPPWVWINSVGE